MIVTVLVNDEEDEEEVDPDGGEEITPDEIGQLHLIRPVDEAIEGSRT